MKFKNPIHMLLHTVFLFSFHSCTHLGEKTASDEMVMVEDRVFK